MAWTADDLAALEAAYKSGVKKVKFKDRETEYRDLAEIKQIMDEARTQLAGNTRKPYFYTSYNRGYQ